MPSLTKWYLDVVTDDGAALIVYAASLGWGALHVEFASTLLARPGAPPIEETAWSGVELPEHSSVGVRFRHDGLGVAGHWRGLAAPIEATLLDDEMGLLSWECILPVAAVDVRFPGGALTGRGYVERLTMTRVPWSLPLRTLRWGRFISPTHGVVWIDWQGGPPRRWLWLDGVLQPSAGVRDTGLTGLDGDRELRLVGGRELCDRRSLQVLSKHLPALDTLPLGPLRDLRETKRLSRGSLRRAGAVEDDGWAIHEIVSW